MSAIAIPNFLAFQARGRRAEATTNLTALSRHYKSFFAEENLFPDITVGPPGGVDAYPAPPVVGAPTTGKTAWPADAFTFFGITGFEPTGPIYYQYGVLSTTCGCNDCFTAYAYGDVDGDGSIGGLIYVHPSADPTITCFDAIVGSWTEPPGATEQAVPVTPGVDADDF
jgi:hypothetical protein